MSGMRRREFVALFGGAAAWPIAARGQQPTMPVIGFLSSGTPETFAPYVAAFRKGLNETGYVDGQTVAIEYRWAEANYDRLPALSAELVRRPVAVIFASGGVLTAHAAKAATATIPIVYTGGGDPVKLGLVASLNRPSGNITGVNFLANELGAKRLELLQQLVPKATLIGFLVNPRNRNAESETSDMEEAARALGRQAVVLRASIAGDLESAFATLAQRRAGALVVAGDPFFDSQRSQIVALAARHSLPMYFLHGFVTAGGLMSYGASITDAYRQAAIYAGKILNGAKPADLPIVQPTKFELVLNLKTAKALGLEIPDKLLATADEVIE
jgi:putative tryptophan/tyrosine transport system substrate-binding protein